MGGKSSSGTAGYRYFLAGVHAVVCMGVADYIKQLRADGKTAWSGENDGTTTISINRPDLFGGDAQEGGWVGDIDVLPGGPAQTTNTTLTDKRGTNIPAYRRVTSLVFKSFNFGANNPNFKPFSVLVQRILKAWDGSAQWYSATAEIPAGLVPGDGVTTGLTNGATVTQVTAFDYFNAADGAFGAGPVYRLAFQNTYADGAALTALTSVYQSDLDTTLNTWTMDAQNPSSPSRAWATDPLSGLSGNRDGYVIVHGVPTFGTDSTYQMLDLSEILAAGVNHSGVQIRATIELAEVNATIGISAYDADGNGFPDLASPTNVVVRSVNGTSGSFQTGDSGWATVPAGKRFIRLEISAGANLVYRDARVYLKSSDDLMNMNPVHIIREVQTTPVIGEGQPTADIDDINYRAVADTLFAEGFGLSYKWAPGNETPADFLQRVRNTINASHFVHRRTGLWTLKLHRDDYTVGSLTTYTEGGDVLSSDLSYEQRDDLPNKIVARYYDRNIRDFATVSATNPAAYQQTGLTKINEVDHSGITEASLGSRVCERDLRTASTPKIKGTLVCKRTMAGLHPGDVFLFDSTVQGLSQVVFRVLEVDEGERSQGKGRAGCQFVGRLALQRSGQQPVDRCCDRGCSRDPAPCL